MMAESSLSVHHDDLKRPRGILKNSHPRSPPSIPVTVAEPSEVLISTKEPPEQTSHLTERDIVLKNTLKNAGRRRSSSNQPRAAVLSSRRHSHQDDGSLDGSPRLKWDEANLYLTEQERTPKMKIDEPKTPFAKSYDPTEDEAELRLLDAENIAVDEVEAHHRQRRTLDLNTIPALDIGEPKAAPEYRRRESHYPKQVVVKEDTVDGHMHLPGDPEKAPEEEEKKHKQFEEARKKHYEMKNVANLLGHPEYLEDEDDDGDVELRDADGGKPNEDTKPDQVMINGSESVS